MQQIDVIVHAMLATGYLLMLINIAFPPAPAPRNRFSKKIRGCTGGLLHQPEQEDRRDCPRYAGDGLSIDAHQHSVSLKSR
jgi:hypothetical protein